MNSQRRRQLLFLAAGLCCTVLTYLAINSRLEPSQFRPPAFSSRAILMNDAPVAATPSPANDFTANAAVINAIDQLVATAGSADLTETKVKQISDEISKRIAEYVAERLAAAAAAAAGHASTAAPLPGCLRSPAAACAGRHQQAINETGKNGTKFGCAALQSNFFG